MQLRWRRGRDAHAGRTIAASLAMATCSLLRAETGPSVVAEEPRRWLFDTGVLYFGEQDRIQDLSASALIRRLFTGDRRLSLRLVYDTLTGASANGAVPANSPQTFTSASGGKAYTVQPGETPLDPTFMDVRVALDAGWDQPVGASSRAGFGLAVSSETDYLSTGLNARLSRDFNQHNTTLGAGASFEWDSIEPLGGVPVPFGAMGPPREDDDEDESTRLRLASSATLPPPPGPRQMGDVETKRVTDLLLGVTQVFGPRTVGMLNYSYSRSTGYLTDPYKILSVVDPVTGDPVADPNGMYVYLFESRPETRTKHGLYGEVRHHFPRDVVAGSYRFMTDDWGIQSHTFEASYRLQPGRFYVQPHLRWYTQSAADFYERVLFAGDAVPHHASADYRLGKMDAWTAGVKYGLPLDDSREWSVRVEYYAQSGSSPPESQVGSLEGFDLFPDVNSLIVQVGFSF
jgi:hypothetical protein